MTPEERNLTQTIGQRLRAVRKASGLSLQQVTDRTDGILSTSRISNYEQGLRRLSIEAARLLAEAFGCVSPAYLLCLERSGQPFDADELGLIAAFRAADARGQEVILAVTEAQPRAC